MEEMKKGPNSEFRPRPKPTLGEIKDSGVRKVVGVAPRPKPDFSKKKIPPRPMPAKPPARPMPPVQAEKPKVKPKEEVKEKSSGESSTLKAYNDMLSNMQLMNAIGIVNGIYQNAQMNNNRQYDNKVSNLDKQTLFDEFYEYMTNKMQKDGKINIAEQVAINREDSANLATTAIVNAKMQGVSLDNYLESMCNEDEFIKFNLEPLKVENLGFSQAIVSPVPFVRAYEYGDVIAVGEYTNEDYQNLINKNYSVYIDPLKPIAKQEDEEVIEIAIPDKDQIKEEQATESDEEFNVDDIIDIGQVDEDESIADMVAEEVLEEEKADETDDTNIIQDFSNIESNVNENSENQLNNLLDDIAGDNRKQEIKDDYEESAKAEEEKLAKRNQALIDFLNRPEEDEGKEDLTAAGETSEEIDPSKFDDFVYEAMNKDAINEREVEERKRQLEETARDNDNLRNQINELSQMVSSLRDEVVQHEEQNETLKKEYEEASSKSSEKDKTIARDKGDIAELQRENDFMRDVVQSLMVEVQELKNAIYKKEKAEAKKEKESKKKKEELIVAPIMMDIPKPVAEETKEKQEEPIIEEKVQESEPAIEEQVEELSIPEVNNTTEDVYNVDNIIIEEDGGDVSGHFVDKIKNAEDSVKNIYNEIRNYLLSYKDVKGRCSSACDTFRLNGSIIAKFLLIGRTIKLYLALNPEDENLPQNIYHQKDESKKKAYKETPFMVRLQSDLAIRKAKKLIDYMFDELDVVKDPKYEYEDFANTLERQVVKNK